jgi:C4-dicarboxylate transporter DctQ subunit
MLTTGTGSKGGAAAGPSVATMPARGLAWIRRIVDGVLVILLCAMVGLIMFQVLGRYVFNYSISWSEEAASFALVWMTMLGAGLAMRTRSHVGIDVLVTRTPRRVQQIAKSASFLLGAWFLVVVIVGSFGLISLGMIVRSTALQIPMAVPYLALPVGMSYFLLEFAIATLPEIRHAGRAPASRAEAGGE